MSILEKAILDDMSEAEYKAWDSLSRYKFMMFGYWASIWVHLNQISGTNAPNPWGGIVIQAKEREGAERNDYYERKCSQYEMFGEK